jgi:sulfite reductase (NADPH) flavoprotein alpha-component
MSTESASVYSKKNPFPAKLRVNRKLTLEGSGKETRHFELSLEGSGLNYEVGDSLGVIPTNCPELVEDLIDALHATGDEIVIGSDGTEKPLRQALLSDYQITQPSNQFIEAIAQRGGTAGAPLINELLDPLRKPDLEAYLWGLEYIDLLCDHPSMQFTPAEFVKFLRRQIPRLYSIASSLKTYPEAVHLTIAVVRYETHGRRRKGVASTYLADRCNELDGIPVFVHTAKGFRLPEDPNTPIIMVGPGTGVAPFRAYLQERKAVGAKGRNWLFFGDQHEKTDFMYRDEFEQAQRGGILTKFSTAFSRDIPNKKVYVQDRMMEDAGEFWAWLDGGAHFYVCGDAKRMAKDVDATLHKIVQEQGGKSVEEAALYVEGLKKAKRYKRDVY